jgi:prepilin-type N-terminal cleavage/methylation domain-containing protein
MSTPRLGDERGFTLVELLVAMTIGMIVSFAVLGVFDGFNRGVASNSRLTDAQDSARREVSQMVAVLRVAGAPASKTAAQVSMIVSAAANDVVFRSTSWPGENSTGTAAGTYHTQRLCLDTATKTVWFDAIRAGAAGTTAPGSACPSTAAGWTHTAMARDVVNTTADPLFRIGAAPIRSIGLSLRLEGGTTASSRPLELDSGGTVRGGVASQITAADISACNDDARPLLSLNLAGLSLTSTSPSIPVGPGKILLAAGAAGNISLTVTNVLGLQTQLTKSVNALGSC